MKKPHRKNENRSAPRREVSPLSVTSVSSLEDLTKIAKFGEITQASVSGIRLTVNRTDLVPVSLKRTLTLDSLVGERVLLYLPQMHLEISGTIVRTRLLGKLGFEIGIDFSEDAPHYWRECLLDLLPMPGELD